MNERLTSLDAVKDWLDITTDDSDGQLTRLIDAASQFVLGFLNRDSFQATTYTQNFKGNGKDTTLLRNWPILSITSVGIGGKAIPMSSPPVNGLPGHGYMVSDLRQAPQSLDLYGYHYGYGVPSQIVYVAGFQTTQTFIVPPVGEGATYATFVPSNMGCWSGDLGVKDGDVELILNTSGTPADGEYFVDGWGTYSFNEAQVGQELTVCYNYTPWAVQQAVTELIGEWYRRKDRIGILSKTLGGQETITFSQKDMNDSIRGSLQIYQNVVPV